MANNDAAFGLRPIGDFGGGTYAGKLMRVHYLVGTDKTSFVGSLVKPTGSSDADGVISVTSEITTGDSVLGVVVGFEPLFSDLSLNYRKASTLRYAWIVSDPNAMFVIQADATDAITDVGSTADLINFDAGSTTYGTSTTELSTSTMSASGDGTQDVIVVGGFRVEDNAIGEFTRFIVRLNNHFLTDAQAGA